MRQLSRHKKGLPQSDSERAEGQLFCKLLPTHSGLSGCVRSQYSSSSCVSSFNSPANAGPPDQGHTNEGQSDSPQPEVIRAIMLKDSPHVLHGLCDAWRWPIRRLKRGAFPMGTRTPTRGEQRTLALAGQPALDVVAAHAVDLHRAGLQRHSVLAYSCSRDPPYGLQL